MSFTKKVKKNPNFCFFLIQPWYLAKACADGGTLTHSHSLARASSCLHLVCCSQTNVAGACEPWEPDLQTQYLAGAVRVWAQAGGMMDVHGAKLTQYHLSVSLSFSLCVCFNARDIYSHGSIFQQSLLTQGCCKKSSGPERVMCLWDLGRTGFRR